MKATIEIDYQLELLSDELGEDAYDYKAAERSCNRLKKLYGALEFPGSFEIDFEIIPNIGDEITFEGSDFYLVVNKCHRIMEGKQSIELMLKYNS